MVHEERNPGRTWSEKWRMFARREKVKRNLAWSLELVWGT